MLVGIASRAEADRHPLRAFISTLFRLSLPVPTLSYHWIRILIRAPCATDPLLGLSSLPVMLSSARTIVQNYQTLFNTQRYIWPILALARVVGSGNCIMQAYARGELPQREAEELVAVVLSLLNNFEKRLPVAATSYNNFCILASAFGEPRGLSLLSVQNADPLIVGLNVTAAASPGWTGDLFTTDTFPTSIPSDFGAFSFDPAFDTMMNPLWTLSQMEEVWGGQVGALPTPSPAF